MGSVIVGILKQEQQYPYIYPCVCAPVLTLVSVSVDYTKSPYFKSVCHSLMDSKDQKSRSIVMKFMLREFECRSLPLMLKDRFLTVVPQWT